MRVYAPERAMRVMIWLAALLIALYIALGNLVMVEATNMNDNKDFAQARLSALLEPLNVPLMRRDLDNMSNLRWLQRNVRINNSEAESLDTIHLLIRTLIRRGSN